MATEMAAATLTSSPASGAMPADCPMHLQASLIVADADPQHAPAGMAGCGSCDLCLPIAEAAAVDVDVAPAARHAKPPSGSTEFLSAFVALNLKPPTF
jgi:hypothetical protein